MSSVMRMVLSVVCRTSYSNVTQQHGRDKGGAMDSCRLKEAIAAAVQLPATLYISYTNDAFFMIPRMIEF